jgi:hypothetical protein
VLEMDMTSTLILVIGLAFAMGYAFTMVPMLRTMSLKQAAKVTVIGDTVSIAAMENSRNLASIIDTRVYARSINRCIILDRARNNTTCRFCSVISSHVLGYETWTTARD